MGHGETAVHADLGDGPAVAVADGFAPIGTGAPVVAAGRHDVADRRGFAARDRRERAGAVAPALTRTYAARSEGLEPPTF